MEQPVSSSGRLIARLAYTSDDIEAQFRALRSAIDGYRDLHLAAVARAEAAEERLKAYDHLEVALGRVVLRAQRAVDEMLAQAGRESAEIMAEAHRRAAQMVAGVAPSQLAEPVELTPTRAPDEIETRFDETTPVIAAVAPAVTTKHQSRLSDGTTATWWTRAVKFPSMLDRSDPFFNPSLRWERQDGNDGFLAQLADGSVTPDRAHEDAVEAPPLAASTIRPARPPHPVGYQPSGGRRRHRKAHGVTPSLTRRLGVLLGFTRM